MFLLWNRILVIILFNISFSFYYLFIIFFYAWCYDVTTYIFFNLHVFLLFMWFLLFLSLASFWNTEQNADCFKSLLLFEVICLYDATLVCFVTSLLDHEFLKESCSQTLTVNESNWELNDLTMKEREKRSLCSDQILYSCVHPHSFLLWIIIINSSHQFFLSVLAVDSYYC